MISSVKELNDLVKEYEEHVPSIDILWKKVKSIAVKEVDHSVEKRVILVYEIIENLLKSILEDIKNNQEQRNDAQLDVLTHILAILYIKVVNNNDLLQVCQLELPFDDSLEGLQDDL